VSNVLSEEKKQQAVALGRLGSSLRRIQKAIGVRRETVSAYLKSVGVAMRPPRGQITPAKLASREDGVITDPRCAKPASPSAVFTDSGGESAALAKSKSDPRRDRSPSSSACIPYRDAIELGLSRGRNAMAIWQEMVDTCGFVGSYQSVRRFVARLHGSQHPEACAVIETPPGEESQVDYGDGPMVRDPQSGKYRRTRLFVLTLGYSRKSVRLLVFRSSSQTWAELHEKAFRRLGGVTRVVVLDKPASSPECKFATSPSGRV
jgi:transposase